MGRVEIDLPYIKKVTRRNKRRSDAVYWYSVAPGLSRVQIGATDPRTGKVTPYEYGSDAFISFVRDRNARAAKLDELAKEHAIIPGTWRDLSDHYFGFADRGIEPSREFTELGSRAQADYEDYVAIIVERFGEFQVSEMDAEIVDALHQDFKDTPYAANALIKAMGSMIRVAIRKRSIFGITSDPTANVKRFGVKAGVKARDQYWTYEQESLFQATAAIGFWYPKRDANHWRTNRERVPENRWLLHYREKDREVVLGELLLACTGQRCSDVLRMSLSDYDGEKIRVRQSKTGMLVWIPCHRDLRPYLDEMKAEAKKAGILNRPILTNADGAAFTYRAFAERWDAVAWACGLHGLLRRQDLRRTAVVRMFEAGCEVGEIAAITGHSLAEVTKILETYFVRTYPMAQNAIAKLEDYQERLKKLAPATP